ncbi:MAG: glycosyltransferase [Chloroflexota bacterium]
MDIHLLRTFIINSITAGVTIGLALNRLRNRELMSQPWPVGQRAPMVEVIIPARNEECNIGPLLDTLLTQRYPTDSWRISVVDDGSTDRTAEIVAGFARRHSQVRLLSAPPLPEGWTGKNHAMHTGLRAAAAEAEYLLFVDADTRHNPDMLSTVVLRARETGADLLSLIIDVEMHSFWERVIVPQVGELYTLLVGSMDSVNEPGGSAAANGQFMLIRREVYGGIVALDTVRGDVAEDRAIAAAAKSRGGTIRLEYGRKLVRARVYSSLPEMWAGYSKTLFWATGHNAPRTLTIAAALALYALAPPIACLHALIHRDFRGRQSALRNAPFQIIPMLALRVAVCRQMGIPPAYALLYPLSVVMGDAMLLFSLYRVLSGKGVRWKGRTYR